MTDILTRATAQLLTPYNLDLDGIDRAMGDLMGPGIDFGDFYFQHSKRENWTFEDGIVKDGAHSIEQGVGVRAVSGEKTGFAYSDDLDAQALIASAHSARAIARDGREHGAQALQRSGGRRLYPALDPVDAMGNEAKVAALRRVDGLLRDKTRKPGKPPLPAATVQRVLDLTLARAGWNVAALNCLDAEYQPILDAEVTEEAVAKYFAHRINGKVSRWRLPGINGFNFLLRQALGGGGMASLRNDPLGKGMAQILLSMPIRVPPHLL